MSNFSNMITVILCSFYTKLLTGMNDIILCYDFLETLYVSLPEMASFYFFIVFFQNLFRHSLLHDILLDHSCASS